jgi:hypothetical protein
MRTKGFACAVPADRLDYFDPRDRATQRARTFMEQHHGGTSLACSAKVSQARRGIIEQHARFSRFP